MKVRTNVFVLIIAGSIISLATFMLFKLTKLWIGTGPAEFNITLGDVLYILFAGVAFAIFMKMVKINSKEI